jgi:hypothetical protein
VIVRPVSVAFTPLETENTSTALLPLTVTRLAPGPLITSGPAVSESVSVLESVIVCGVPKTVGSNWIRLPSALGLELAWLMQKSRSPVVPEPAPVSVVALTV